MSTNGSHRLKLTLHSGRDVTNEMCFQLGQIMHDAVYEPPWLYKTWPLGHPDVAANTDTAVGYMKICRDHDGLFLVLWHELPNYTQTPVGVWAGLPVSRALLPLLHLDHGIDQSAFDGSNPSRAPKLFDGKTFYHLIIAINGASGAENRPLESHRGLQIRGKKVARIMVEYMISLLGGHGYDHLVTKTHPEQEKMVGLFTKTGFVPIGRQVATHGTSSAERLIFCCSPKVAKMPDNTGHLIGEWI